MSKKQEKMGLLVTQNLKISSALEPHPPDRSVYCPKKNKKKGRILSPFNWRPVLS